ncbi:MAG: hypothetical protein SGJ27_24730 [Candidatus Melainabacteria bacterium]|nr:hypothetical protein [Candidatus Melainabacteria bacterium]
MNTNNRQNLQCVARGEGFVPVTEATYFIHQEPVHSGLFEMIGGSWQPVHNTDTSLRVRTCVNRDGLFRAIEDMEKPARAEKRYVGIFSAYQTSSERHPSMPYYPPMCPAYTSVRHFETDKGPDFYKDAGSRRTFKSMVVNADAPELAAA